MLNLRKLSNDYKQSFVQIYNFLKKFLLKNSAPVPFARNFGISLGTPVDRIYIDDFIEKNSKFITSDVFEIGDLRYSKKYSKTPTKLHELNFLSLDDTYAIDFRNKNTHLYNSADCFIVTQTFNFIFDLKLAFSEMYHILKPNGTALVTVSGISQISNYDMQRWGDFWRFTNKSLQCMLELYFQPNKIKISTYGNVYSSNKFLNGFPAQLCDYNKLMYNDPDYQVIICAVATK